MDNSNMSASFKTRMKILNALGDLCKEFPYERISTMEICKCAEVSRSTFYHHFFGKDDITQWHSNIIYESGVDRIGRDLGWFGGHLITTRAFEPYKHIYKATASLENPSGPRTAFVRHRVEVLEETLTQYHHIELTPLLQFQIHAIAVAEATESLQWFCGNSPFESVKDFCRAMESIVPHELHEALKNPVEEQNPSMFFAGTIW